MDTYFTTLVLSGESLCGMATVGACQKLKEFGLLESIDTIIGVSSGALIGALLVVGYSPLELSNYFIRENLHDLLQPTFSFERVFHDRALMDFRPIEEHLKKLLQAKSDGKLPTFAELERRTGNAFVTVAYNLTKKSLEIFDPIRTPDILVHEAARASCSLPLLFPRCIWQDDTYLDGGMVNNLPVDLSTDLCHTLAIVLDRTHELSTWIAYMANSLRVSVNHRTRESIQRAKESGATVLTIPVHETIPSGIETYLAFFDAGYSYVQEWGTTTLVDQKANRSARK